MIFAYGQVFAEVEEPSMFSFPNALIAMDPTMDRVVGYVPNVLSNLVLTNEGGVFVYEERTLQARGYCLI